MLCIYMHSCVHSMSLYGKLYKNRDSIQNNSCSFSTSLLQKSLKLIRTKTLWKQNMEYAKISKYPKARYLIFYKYCTYPWMIWLSSVAWLNIPLLSCIPEIEQEEEEEEEEESIPIVPCLFSFALLLILFALTLETLCTLTWPKIFPHVEHALQCNTPSSHENQDSKN